VLLPPVFTPQATAAAVARLREACERIDRDPATLRICQCVITAPELDDEEARALAHGRAVSYFVYPGYGENTSRRFNGWDVDVILAVRNHPQFSGLDKIPDMVFQPPRDAHAGRADPRRVDARLLRDRHERTLRGEPAALHRRGAPTRSATYGSTPAQNARADRARPATQAEDASPTRRWRAIIHRSLTRSSSSTLRGAGI